MSLKRPTIMIVDDDKINVEILASGFSDRHNIVRCNDSIQALALAIKHQPDVILLDVGMPTLNGYQVCRKLKETESTRNIPVVFSTGHDSEADEITGFMAGASDYITKPFRMDLVKLRLKNVLDLKHKTDLLEELANVDGLTHIANRRRFETIFQQKWQESIVSQSYITVFMIDIDYFKQYNDQYGHAHGDRCLVQIAQVLEMLCASNYAAPARYGGEEFVVVMSANGALSASDFAEAVRVKVLELVLPHKSSKCSEQITVSVGVATTIASHEIDKQMLLEAADKQLYVSKNKGRNQVTLTNMSETE
jgi:two-component system sensor histidine kinase/response regulator